MNPIYRYIIASFLSGLLVMWVAGCSEQDRVISVDADDQEMNLAIAKARSTLPTFWRVLQNPEHGESDFALKYGSLTSEARSISG
jgi:hypothetical protein